MHKDVCLHSWRVLRWQDACCSTRALHAPTTNDRRVATCRRMPRCARRWRRPGHSRMAASTSICGPRVVNRDGVVCAVAFTGNNRGDQWPGSRVISAQKANTANAFSLPGLALVDGEPLHRDAAGRQPVRAAGEQPRRHRRGVRRQPGEQRAEQRSDGGRAHRRRERVRRRARALQRRAASSSAPSASAATRRARTTTSPGGRATP